MDKKLFVKITRWLNGDKEYHSGIQLLKETGRKKAVLRHLSRRENHSNKRKLIGILTSMVSPQQANVLVSSSLVTEPSKTIEIKSLDPRKNVENVIKVTRPEKPKKQNKNWNSRAGKKAIPEEIQVLIQRNAKLYNQRAVLHTEMSSLGGVNNQEAIERRLAIQKEMEIIQGEADSNHQIISKFEASGVVPKKEDEDAKKGLEDKNVDFRRLTNLRSQRTKKSKKIKELPEGPKLKKAVEDMDRINLEISEIEQKLGIKHE